MNEQMSDTLERLKNALMPLLKEGIADAEWSKGTWVRPYWRFSISTGSTRHIYSLGPLENAPGEAPVILDVVDYTRENLTSATLPGIFLVATQWYGLSHNSDGGLLLTYYEREDGPTPEQWAADFIVAAKNQLNRVK